MIVHKCSWLSDQNHWLESQIRREQRRYNQIRNYFMHLISSHLLPSQLELHSIKRSLPHIKHRDALENHKDQTWAQEMWCSLNYFLRMLSITYSLGLSTKYFVKWIFVVEIFFKFIGCASTYKLFKMAFYKNNVAKTQKYQRAKSKALKNRFQNNIRIYFNSFFSASTAASAVSWVVTNLWALVVLVEEPLFTCK